MKRFTESNKWDDPWFRKLPIEQKAMWWWILDKCDNAGVIEPDIDLASFQIGHQYPIDTLLSFGDRVVSIGKGKWFIPKFIEFQYGKLSVDCKAHNPVFISLKKHGLEGYPKAINSLQEKDKEKDKEKDSPDIKPKGRGTLLELRSFAVELGLPISDGEYLFHQWEENGWTNSGKPVKDWKAGMRKRYSAGWLPSQKTSTQTRRPGLTSADVGI